MLNGVTCVYVYMSIVLWVYHMSLLDLLVTASKELTCQTEYLVEAATRTDTCWCKTTTLRVRLTGHT